jgi:hypothetical protein
MTWPKLNIHQMQEIAKSKGGECLSKEYINNYTKLKWRCKYDHIFFTIPGSIKRGTWCHKCHINETKHKIIQMQNIAKEHNGKCLSIKYINSRTKLKWECEKKHIFNTIPTTIINKNYWCPICGKEKCKGNKKYTINHIKKIAKSKGGKCLSSKYINNRLKLKFMCKNRHEFDLNSNHLIHDNSWCPKCSSFKSENLCRTYIENKTLNKFIKCKPKWLNGLELDGYCKELNLAFEYNGIQHYKIHKYFRQNKKQFINQQKRDKLKRKLCRLNKVKLITIPFNYNCYNPNKIYKFIDYQLKQKGLIRI